MSASNKAGSPAEKFSCLIVEDDNAFATMAGQVVREQGGEPTLAATLSAARAAIVDRSFDLVLLDNHLPDGKGYDFFDQLFRRYPEAPIVMITGMPDLGEAVALTRNGLSEYLTKPVTVEALAACLQRAKLRLQTRTPTADSAEWFGDSPAMRDVLKQLHQAAKHPASTVLFTGETGTGKDLAARVLHQLTYPNANAPFVAVNCAAVPAEMFESELFGAERGAFTGADKKRVGLVGAAAGGTLFLDEIAEVPLALQAKLLRLLESGEYRALGSTESLSFSGRFVAATNKSLAEEVKANRFREDLLYRLDVFTVALPPLRKHRADISGIAELFVTQLAKKYNRTKPRLRPEDLSALNAHNFPGNVRELRNVIERSLLMTLEESRWLALDLNWLNRGATATTKQPVPLPSTEPLPPDRDLSPVEAQEYRLIQDTLRETNGGIRRAAAKLGMSPQALLRRLEKWPELRVAKE
ncbi:MAG: sigma-54-dependent Fis family transcriptional regulator [Verrucomicrobia bacterium]|nr:sigma-54-dependent Fis family transcriptional regulator [Verrucomicrobiota bacterium]